MSETLLSTATWAVLGARSFSKNVIIFCRSPAGIKPQEAKKIIDLLRDTLSIQGELLKRSEYVCNVYSAKIKQLQLQVEEDNTTIVELLNEKKELDGDKSALRERVFEMQEKITDLKAEINLIDPTGEARLEYF